MLEKFDACFDDDFVRVEHIRATTHPVGSSYLSPDKKQCYVNIPKNSSTTMKYVLKDWSFVDWHDCAVDVEFLVILRDPTRRWISAVSEFLCGQNGIGCMIAKETNYVDLLSIPLIKNWIFESVYLDAHCLPQCYFLQDLPLHKIKFFNQDLDGAKKICEYLQIKDPVPNLNQTDAAKKTVERWLEHQLIQNKELQHVIDVHYWCDHKLLDRAAVIS